MQITFNQDKLKAAIEAYKKDFSKNIGNEIYKWKAVKSFQNNWNIGAKNFSEMFYNSTKTADNLLVSQNHFPRRMIRELAEKDPEAVRNMFRNLYDESLELGSRIDDFISASEKLVNKYFPGKAHYQDYNSVSTYLWLKYPNEYYIYKYSEIKKVTTTLDVDLVIKKGTISSVINTFDFYDEIVEILNADPSIRSMLNEVLTTDCDKDENLHCAIVDFVFFISRRYSEDQSQPSQVDVIASEENERNYWWLVSNPKVWRISSIKPGEEQNYSLYTENGNQRRVFQNFLDAKPRDLVIGYEANPVKKVTALAEISKSAEETGNYSISVKKTRTLLEPVTYAQVKENPALSEMEFLKNRNGSLFRLKKEEYEALMDMILEQNSIAEVVETEKYTAEDFLSEVFVTKEKLAELKSLVKTKKNVILQGAPGVGKTFCAKRLAYTLMGEKNESRVSFVQFHQNYSYEDFVMGYKPTEDGGFELKNGIFYKACIQAQNDPDRDYFFIIDEINRGNLSKIFGELLMLIENSYRDKSLTLAYKDELFCVPSNVYIIGMMNTADRSLAMIDYALRRRFSFFEMTPSFDSDGFKAYMSKWENPHFEKLIGVVKELNKAIASDDSLGTGFEIGHSYFCGCEECTDSWLKSIVNYDIIPMLQEYWFDNKNEVQKWGAKLLAAIND